jgi:hypothetical protein
MKNNADAAFMVFWLATSSRSGISHPRRPWCLRPRFRNQLVLVSYVTPWFWINRSAGIINTRVDLGRLSAKFA